MKYAVEMGSVVMIYIPSFIKTGSGIQKLIGEGTQTHRQDGDRISLLYESRLMTCHFVFSCQFIFQNIVPAYSILPKKLIVSFS
jgi:hypothetical protein